MVGVPVPISVQGSACPCARHQRLWVGPPQSPTHPLPPAVGEVLPEQQPQLGAHGHRGGLGPGAPLGSGCG